MILPTQVYCLANRIQTFHLTSLSGSFPRVSGHKMGERRFRLGKAGPGETGRSVSLSGLTVWSHCLVSLVSLSGLTVWSHWSHCVVSLCGLTVWPHCLVSLSGLTVWSHCLCLTVWSHCLASLSGLTVWSHCLVSLSGLTVWSHCHSGLLSPPTSLPSMLRLSTSPSPTGLSGVGKCSRCLGPRQLCR